MFSNKNKKRLTKIYGGGYNLVEITQKRGEKMAIDTILLRKKVRGNFLEVKDFEKAIGRSHSYVNRILNGHVVDNLQLGTIYKMIDVLHLSSLEVNQIFFNKIE